MYLFHLLLGGLIYHFIRNFKGNYNEIQNHCQDELLDKTSQPCLFLLALRMNIQDYLTQVNYPNIPVVYYTHR